MKKISIYNLVVEVTRECNMKCDHCMRGRAQNVTMDIEYVKNVFREVNSIGSITLTGGEPSLRVEIIREILDAAKEFNVDIGNFYMATNCSCASDELIKVLMDWYLFCSENDITAVDVSNDIFHDDVDTRTFDKLSILRFVRKKHNNEDYDYDDYANLQGTGYGRDYVQGKEIEPSEYIIRDGLEIYESELALNCHGNIIAGCDWSYEDQEEEDLIICKSSEFGNIIDIMHKKGIAEEE